MLAPQQRQVLAAWIRSNLIRFPKAHRNRTLSSYTLKHHFEASPREFYLTAADFEDAMRAEGYKGRRLDDSGHLYYWLRLRGPEGRAA